MILYRPVGLKELELIYEGGMKAFPARLPQQPIFYPVIQLEYARQIASDWNAKNGQFAGYVTQFQVEDQYIGQFEKHTVGGSQHQEFWIPAEELEEFNKHILGHIKVLEAHFGDGFQGFIPGNFALQGKNAIDQFTVLTNFYLYKRMDFYLEIKRNHKAVFLNYPFWQTHDFKNPGLKKKIIQAVKEAWLTSFPQIPLPLPVQEETPLVKQTDPSSGRQSSVNLSDEEIGPVEETDTPAQPLVNPVHEDAPRTKQTDPSSSLKSIHEDVAHVEQTDESAHVEHSVNSVHEEPTPVKQANSKAPRVVPPLQAKSTPPKQIESHFVKGIQLGLSGQFGEAIDELSKAIEEEPDNVVVHTSLGVAFHRLGEDDRALTCYETALQKDPIYAEAHYFRANILYGRGNVREAIAGYRMTIGLKPELIEAHQTLAPQDRLTDYTGAPAEIYPIAKPAHRILELNKLLESNPGQSSLLKERAAEYYRLRNYVQAITDYSSSLAIQPNDEATLHARGVAYEKLGQSDRARQDYQKAIAINPQLSNVYINRGVTLGKSGNYRQSIGSFTDAIRLAPKNPDGYFNRGTAYFQLGDFEAAIADFSKVIQLSPRDEDAYYWRGISNEQAGRQQDALADYRQFLAISQNPGARAEIEQRLSQLSVRKPEVVKRGSEISNDSRTTNQVKEEKLKKGIELYDLIVALGERVIGSTWFGSDVECYGEKADELQALTDQNQPILGGEFLDLTSGISQTIEGDFQAFDPGAAAPWFFIRAWDGSGFYMETNDPEIKQRLKIRFPAMEEVERANPPYEGLFIRI